MLNVTHSHHSGTEGLVVHVEVHQSVTTTTNAVDQKRAANAKQRRTANQVAEIFSATMRTGARTPGANPAPLGMSALELSPP